MKIGTARAIARAWVEEQADALSGYTGAFLAGSTNDLPAGAMLDTTSDLDIMVVLESADIPEKPGKFRYRDVLLEASILDAGSLRDVEMVLGHYHLGRVMATARILSDPTGFLTGLQESVAQRFADREWIERRVNQAAETVLTRLDSIVAERSFEENAMAWLFAVGGLPHVLLVAGLRNPTVRKRYVAVRDLLNDIGHEGGLYDAMMDALDPERMPSERIRHHLDELACAFDAASSVARSPFFFASDLSAEARPLAIDGSRELIDAGMYREAIFWIVATFCRCQIVLHADAPPELAHRWDDAFRELLSDLGIVAGHDLTRRADDVRNLLPRVCDAAVKVTNLVLVCERA